MECRKVEIQALERKKLMGVLVYLNFEIPNDGRRDPPATQFHPRKYLLIEDDAFAAILPECPGTGRAGRASAYDDRFRFKHGEWFGLRRDRTPLHTNAGVTRASRFCEAGQTRLGKAAMHR